jgi:hypothetical protein
MSRWRRLGRAIERFRQLTLAAAEEATEGRGAIHCEACEAWIPRRFDQCPECGRVSPRAVLGVPPDAPEEDVRAAAREKLKATHPDQGGSRDAFERVKDARDRLLE